MTATPENDRHIAAGKLDHPEGICLTEEGVIYAGGETEQIDRISGGNRPLRYRRYGDARNV